MGRSSDQRVTGRAEERRSPRRLFADPLPEQGDRGWVRRSPRVAAGEYTPRLASRKRCRPSPAPGGGAGRSGPSSRVQQTVPVHRAPSPNGKPGRPPGGRRAGVRGSWRRPSPCYQSPAGMASQPARVARAASTRMSTPARRKSSVPPGVKAGLGAVSNPCRTALLSRPDGSGEPSYRGCETVLAAQWGGRQAIGTPPGQGQVIPE
jgi:hypothetical protein